MDFSNIARQLNEGTEAVDAEVTSSEKAKTGGEKQINNTARRRESQKAHMSQQGSTPVKSDVSYASEGYKPFPGDKVTKKVKALDAEKAMGMGDAKKAKRRMKMDMAVYVDKDPELRGMHRSAKQTVEKNNRERGRKKMEESRADREYVKMMEAAKADWRQELMEAAKPDEEGNHPYVDVMPFMNQKAKEAKQQMKGAAKMSGDNQAKMANEEMSVQDQLKVSNEYFTKRNARPQAEKDAEKMKNQQSARKTLALHKKPDPYKARAGESD